MCGFQALSYLSDARVVDIWEVIGTDVHRHRSFCADLGAYYPRIEFTVYLDRKPLFYIVNIIIPVIFLVLVVLMVWTACRSPLAFVVVLRVIGYFAL